MLVTRHDNRCKTCGKFIKRGIVNMIDHYDKHHTNKITYRSSPLTVGELRKIIENIFFNKYNEKDL